MGIKVTGLTELNAALNDFLLDTEKALDDAVLITAAKVKKSAVKSIKEPGDMGIWQKRWTAPEKDGGSSYMHLASAPGNAPNTDTGRLISDLFMSHSKGSQVAYVGNHLDYALYLETVHDRPYLEPAKEDNVKNFDKLLKKVLLEQVKSAGK